MFMASLWREMKNSTHFSFYRTIISPDVQIPRTPENNGIIQNKCLWVWDVLWAEEVKWFSRFYTAACGLSHCSKTTLQKKRKKKKKPHTPRKGTRCQRLLLPETDVCYHPHIQSTAHIVDRSSTITPEVNQLNFFISRSCKRLNPNNRILFCQHKYIKYSLIWQLNSNFSVKTHERGRRGGRLRDVDHKVLLKLIM